MDFSTGVRGIELIYAKAERVRAPALVKADAIVTPSLGSKHQDQKSTKSRSCHCRSSCSSYFVLVVNSLAKSHLMQIPDLL